MGLRLVVSFVPEISCLISEEKGQVLTRRSESSVPYLLLAMSVFSGISAWFTKSNDRAAGMMILAIFSTLASSPLTLGSIFCDRESPLQW